MPYPGEPTTDRPRLTSIKIRPWLWAAALWLGIVAVLTMAWHVQHLNTVRQEALSTGAMRLNGLRDNLESQLRNVAGVGHLVAQEAAILEALRGNWIPDPTQVDDGNRTTLRQMLLSQIEVRNLSRRLQRLVKDFRLSQIYLQDINGTVIADSLWQDEHTTLGANFRVRDAFSLALQTGESFQYVSGRVSKRSGFNISVRVDDADRPMGLLVLKLDLQATPQLFDDPQGRALLVVDTNGVIVYGNRPEWRLRQVPGSIDLSGQLRDAQGLYLGVPKPVDWAPESIDVNKAAVPGWRIHGLRHLAQTASVPGAPVAVWVLSPLSAERDTLDDTLAFSCVVLLLGWAALWLLWRGQDRLAAAA